MAQDPATAWWDVTWNPVRGCTRTSPGCDHCFAARYAERWRGVAGHPYERGFDVRPVADKLDLPLRWERSQKVLVASMSDLFHEQLSDDYVASALEVLRLADWHHFFVLTKRPERMRRLWRRSFAKRPPEHVWLGVSVEDRKHGRPRIAKLRSIPAARRFVCFEPLLEDPGKLDLTGIDWVVLGGETGPGARVLEHEWVISVHRQCRAARIPFFFKQWGGPRHGASGRELDGRRHDRLPALPKLRVPGRATRRDRLYLVCDPFEDEVARPEG